MARQFGPFLGCHVLHPSAASLAPKSHCCRILALHGTVYMPSGWHLSIALCSSRAFLYPLLNLFEVKTNVLSELAMGDWIGCVLLGSVVNKRDLYSEQVRELSRAE